MAGRCKWGNPTPSELRGAHFGIGWAHRRAGALSGLAVRTAARWRSAGTKKKECGPRWAQWEDPRPRPGSSRGCGGRKGGLASSALLLAQLGPRNLEQP